MKDELNTDTQKVPADTLTDSPTRRRMLKLAAVGLGGVGLAVTTGVGTAEAAHQNEDVGIGIINTNAGGVGTTLNTTGSIDGTQLLIQSGENYTSGGSAFNAALGGWAAHDGTADTGVYAYSEIFQGAALVASAGAGAVALRLVALDFLTKPSSGTYSQGDVISAGDGVWLCVAAGTPGTWRKVGGLATAGAFHAISPHRVYDSRHSTILHDGDTRTVTISNGINAAGAVDAADLVPVGATAISVNVTVAETHDELVRRGADDRQLCSGQDQRGTPGHDACRRRVHAGRARRQRLLPLTVDYWSAAPTGRPLLWWGVAGSSGSLTADGGSGRRARPSCPLGQRGTRPGDRADRWRSGRREDATRPGADRPSAVRHGGLRGAG
jgi:hypothetical protein